MGHFSTAGWATATFGLLFAAIAAVIIASNTAWDLRDVIETTKQRSSSLDEILESPAAQLNMTNCSALATLVDDVIERGVYISPSGSGDPETAELPYRVEGPVTGLLGIMPPTNAINFPRLRINSIAKFNYTSGARISNFFDMWPCAANNLNHRTSVTRGPNGTLAAAVYTWESAQRYICTHDFSTGETRYLQVTGMPTAAPNARWPVAYSPQFGYRACNSDQLWSIDEVTGVATNLGGGSIPSFGCRNGLAFAGDRLFSASAQQSAPSAGIIELDPVTGAAASPMDFTYIGAPPPALAAPPNSERWQAIGQFSEDFYQGWGGWATASLTYDYDNDNLIVLGRYQGRQLLYHIKMSEMQSPMDSSHSLYLAEFYPTDLMNQIAYL